jgi:hypothetical protein
VSGSGRKDGVMTERKETAVDGTADDQWRYVRAVLAQRTPQSELAIHRSGGEIIFGVNGYLLKRLAFRVTEMNDDAQCDRDLDALAVLWNTADALLAALDRERKRVAAVTAVLNAPMWESDDETDETICRCEWCLAETATLAATYRCRDCGYQGQPMAWGCLDPENVERMSQERGERYDLGNVTCPVCGEGEFDADPWKALRAIRAAIAAVAPGQPGEKGQGQ